MERKTYVSRFCVLLFLIIEDANVNGVYFLSGNPDHVVIGDNVTVTLTCLVDDSYKIVTWRKDTTLVASIINECEVADTRDTNYTYTCDLDKQLYFLIIPPDAITDGIQNSVWLCLPVVGDTSNSWRLTVAVPVTTVTITPAGDNNVVYIIQGENHTFTCTTDSIRPAAWIQWYIGGQNMTNQATQQTSQQDGDKIISSSSLVYTGRDVDHNKVIFCQALNIEGRQKVNSTEKSLYIQLLVTTVTITPASDNNIVNIIEGKKQTFTCTTDSSRPAAWILWYIGGQNVTNQATQKTSHQDGHKIISSSSLVYTGRDVDHNKVIFCQAVNIEGRQKVKSTEKSLYIQLPVTTVTITPAGDSTTVDITEGESQTFTCTTDSSRPAALIQWYIGGQSVSNEATPQSPQQDGDKVISSSSLVYTGRNVDHNKDIFCEAVNIEGRQKVKSIEKSLYIQLPVTTVTITPAGDNNVVHIIEGENHTFNCTTDSSRPAAWIQWYIGGQNGTNQATPQPPKQDGDRFISSSSLVYTGRDADHNKDIFCEAVNIEGRQKVKSIEKSLYIKLPMTTVTITPAGDNNAVDIIEGETQTFTCTTDSSRPAAWIQWYIGGQNVTNQATPEPPQQDGEKFISSSSLVYTGKDVDHNNFIFCEAVNIEGKQKVKSTEKYLYIQYGPKEITLQPDNKSYTVSEIGSINTINCSASCRPDCRFVWKGPNMFEIQEFNLKFEFVLRNQSGIYVCYVSNNINSSMSQSISVTVNYKPSDLRLEIYESSRVNESESAVFQCNVDSNPASNITWTLTRSGQVLQTNHSVLQSNYTINGAKCTETGTYMCQATNAFNGEMGMAYKAINFFVLCSTRTDDRMQEMPTPIGVTNEEGLNITVFLIAYPKPVIQWVFTSDITNTTINSTHNTFNVFAHVATLYKANMTLTDFGNYTVFAFNEIGETYEKTFIVIPQKTPDPPTNVSASCDILSMTVSWRSEFNGGDLQTFNVLWWKEFENEKGYSDSVSDPGLHKYTEATIPVTADTRYIITVQATNTHGSVTSGEHVSCKTKVLDDTDTPSALIGGVVGSVSGILIIIIIVVVVFFLRRHNNKGDDKKPTERNVPHEDDEDDGLKDNPCYITSPGSSNVDSSAHNNGKGYIYSQVDRTNKTDGLKDNPFCITSPGSSNVDSSAHNNGQGYIYSHVERTNKTGNKEGKGKNLAKIGKMEQKHKDIELDVYENPDKVLNDIQAESVYANSDTNNKMTENDQNKKQKKNKDGLVYADLDLASGPSGSRFVIRGIENRNNYAIIDLTKTPGPLPSDDEDEKHENTVSANRNEP